MNLLIPITGLFMALADTMPGLSGGTICFIMGYYDTFLQSIKDLIHKDTRKQAIKFLFQLGIGWIIGMLVGILLINKLLLDYPYQMISFFLGLVLISIPMTFKSETKYLKEYKNIIFAILGVILVVVISSLGSSIDINIQGQYPFYFYLYVLGVAMLAICAMLLPGISGSTILLIFGIYQIVLDNVKQLLTNFNMQSLCLVITVIVGVLLGALLISKSITNAFKNHRSKILYLIMGMMIGSLYAIWQAPSVLSNEDGVAIMSFSIQSFSPIAFICGICAIIGIEIIKKKLNNNRGIKHEL